MLRWIVVILLVILGCSIHPEAQSRCPNFITAPPEMVIIPPGTSKTVFCQHNPDTEYATTQPDDVITPNPKVDWYRRTTTLIPATEMSSCSCRVGSSSMPLNLTFVDFRDENADDEERTLQGLYRCGAAYTVFGGDVDYCDFQVYLATEPSVMLPRSTVTPDLRSELVISPVIDLGRPEATIEWRRTSTGHLPLDLTRVMIADNGTLRISSVMKEDRGRYLLTATNSEGEFRGMDSASIDVFVNFIDVEQPTVSREGDVYVISCTVTGYPAEGVTLTWEHPGDADVGSMPAGSTEFEGMVTGTARVTVDGCTAGQRYTCRGRTALGTNDGRSYELTREDCPDTPSPSPPSNVRALLINGGFTQIMVTWTRSSGSSAPTGYRVRFTAARGQPETRDVAASASSFNISGLMPSTVYTISVASFNSGGESSFINAIDGTIMTNSCSAPSVPSSVMSVRTQLAQFMNERTLNVSWMFEREPEDTADHFMVTVEAQVTGSTPSSSMVNMQTTFYLLPPSFCNGTTYRITVFALNVCGQAGEATSVMKSCEQPFGNPLTVKISFTESTSMGLVLTPNPEITIRSILVNATTLDLSPDGFILTSVYQQRAYPTNDNFLCIGGLEEDSYYNVCVTPVLDGGVIGTEACAQGSTSNIVSGDNNAAECLSVRETVRSTIPPSSQPFPEWAIAVIVVGALALVALLFCFIGLCFACNTGDGKGEDDMASVSSMQGSSIVPGSVGPYPNMRRTNMSPHRSCLSYHREGHSTNWNDHRDTLKQMETDIGTNV